MGHNNWQDVAKLQHEVVGKKKETGFEKKDELQVSKWASIQKT